MLAGQHYEFLLDQLELIATTSQSPPKAVNQLGPHEQFLHSLRHHGSESLAALRLPHRLAHALDLVDRPEPLTKMEDFKPGLSPGQLHLDAVDALQHNCIYD